MFKYKKISAFHNKLKNNSMRVDMKKQTLKLKIKC